MFSVSKGSVVVLAAVFAMTLAACGQREQPVATPTAPPAAPPVASAPPPPPPAPSPVEEVLPIPLEPLLEDEIADRTLDDLNRDSPLQPAFFALDSAELDAVARAIVTANADVLKRFPSWEITIEGHCDERGTAEYNLALGERRAMAVQTYLVSLGIAPNRVRTVSYGKEFPFDPRSNEEAWAKNRRAHFVITAK
jgi:peptidoglycan-associated lipoprotein